MVAEWDITHAYGWSLWRPFCLYLPDFFSELFFEKLRIGLFDLNKRVKNEIWINNEKIWSRSGTLSHKIAFTDYRLHRDHPPVWDLNLKFEDLFEFSWKPPIRRPKFEIERWPYLECSKFPILLQLIEESNFDTKLNDWKIPSLKPFPPK